MFAATRHLPNEEEAFLADALGKLPDHVTKRPECLGPHVLGSVDAKPIEVGVGDPEAIDESQATQCRGSLSVLPLSPGPDVERFQTEHISLGILRIIIPVHDVPLAEEHLRALELAGPDRTIGPRRPEGVWIGLTVERQRRLAVSIVKSADGIW